MIQTVCTHAISYLSRPTVVVIDVLLFTLAVICIIGIFSLRRQVNELFKAVQSLKSKVIS